MSLQNIEPHKYKKGVWRKTFICSTTDPILLEVYQHLTTSKIMLYTFADGIGYDLFAVRNWFNNRTKNTPNYQHLKCMMDFLNWELTYRTITICPMVGKMEGKYNITVKDPFISSLFHLARSKGYTYNVLAERSSYTANSWQQWAKGNRPISYNALKELCHILSLQLTVLKR